MKKNIIFSALAALCILTGCKEAAEYKSAIYITEAQSAEVKTITISGAGETAELSVSASQRVGKETHVSLEIRPELIDKYNAKYGRECLGLTSEDIEFAKKKVTIKAGNTISDAAEILIKKDIAPGAFYCIPVSIVSTDGDMDILAPSGTLYIILRAPVKSQAVYLGSGNKYIVKGFNDNPKCGETDLSAMKELTLECRVMANSFFKSDPYISSIMGLEGNVCMRFGDVKIGWDVLQVCKADYQPAAINAPCATGQWYHVAAVWNASSLKVYIDGKLITETSNQGETVDITEVQLWNGRGIGFGIGAGSNYNNNRPLDGYIAEARVWSKALTGSEIANMKDLVIVDPQSEGLVAYWKMNEPKVLESSYTESVSGWTIRNEVEDVTGHGYNALGLSGSPSLIETVW